MSSWMKWFGRVSLRPIAKMAWPGVLCTNSVGPPASALQKRVEARLLSVTPGVDNEGPGELRLSSSSDFRSRHGRDVKVAETDSLRNRCSKHKMSVMPRAELY